MGQLFDLDLEDDDIDSVGGLLGKVTGHVPSSDPGRGVGLVLEGEATSGPADDCPP